MVFRTFFSNEWLNCRLHFNSLGEKLLLKSFLAMFFPLFSFVFLCSDASPGCNTFSYPIHLNMSTRFVRQHKIAINMCAQTSPAFNLALQCQIFAMAGYFISSRMILLVFSWTGFHCMSFYCYGKFFPHLKRDVSECRCTGACLV